MTLNHLIDLALAEHTFDELYSAQEVFLRERTNARGQQLLDVHSKDVLDIFKVHFLAQRAFNTDEKIILEGLRTQEQTP